MHKELSARLTRGLSVVNMMGRWLIDREGVLVRWSVPAVMAIWLAASVKAQAQGEGGIDDFLAARHSLGHKEHTQLIVDMDDSLFNQYRTDNIHLNTLLYLAMIRQGTPYRWGGRNWMTGVDCSNFTMKIFQDIGAYYRNFQVTHTLRGVKKSNGYYRVPLDEARAGDMLVYGSYDDGEWNGHVVILVDRDFRHRDFLGLVVGSHGNEVGVRFISYKGFPHYYRRPDIKLRNVLRVEAFADRDAG